MADEINGNTRNQVWSASYAGVEVFQQLYNGTAVMRRRKDSYVNVTQILKCAQYDKPHRTRFLEREIHTGIHEKVQGGYGKYQGTWVPLERAISLARQLNVYDALRHVLEYNPAPGEKPPTAPRSLESMHKRKNARSENSASGSMAKRRATGSPLAQQPGSLSTILSVAGKENIHTPSRLPAASYMSSPASSSQHRQPQAGSTTPANGGMMSWRVSSYTPANARPAASRNSSITPTYRPQQPASQARPPYSTPEATPGNGRAGMSVAGIALSAGGPTAQYQSNSMMNMPPNGSGQSHMQQNRGQPQLSTPTSVSKDMSGSRQASQMADSSGYSPSGRALRDISNTYSNVAPSQMYPAAHSQQQHQHQHQLKKPGSIAASGAGLMTPPSSTSRRTVSAAGNLRLQTNASPAPSQASPSENLSYSRPPVRSHAHSHSSGRSQPAYPWSGSPLSNEITAPRLGLTANAPPVSSPAYSDFTTVSSRQVRSYSGSVASVSSGTSGHSRSASSVSQPQDSTFHHTAPRHYQQQLPPNQRSSNATGTPPTGHSTSLSKLAEFLSHPRTHQHAPPQMEQLVKSGDSLDPNAPITVEGFTALHLAARNAHWDIVQMLLDRGADPTCTNREGKTALMLVVQRAHAWTHRSSHIFEWLLDVFAQSLIRRDKEGRTLVHWACMRPLDPPSNWPEVSLYYMRLLVLKFNETRHLEVFSWCDYLGFSARHIAIQAQQLPAVVSLLDSTCQNAIYPATIRALRAAVEGQISDGAQPHQQSSDDRLALANSSNYEAAASTGGSPGRSNASTSGVRDGWSSQAAAGSPQTLDASTSEQQHVPSKPGRPVNRYDVAASQAVDIIRSSTMELRKQHESQLRQVDEDAEYAAQLLLELRTERDNLQLESAKYQELSLECSEAGSLESMLKSKVNSAINMQQSARASIILQHSAASPLTSASSPSLDGSSTANLRSEYLRLKREAEVYQENSLKLATEYSGLAAVVKPWPRPPALSLVGMFGDGGSAEGHISSDVRLHGSGALAHHGRGGVSGSKPRAIREIAVIDSESADVKAISSALEVDEQRLRKFERVVSAACGDLSLDRVRNVVGPVLSVLNNGNTL